MLTSKQQGNLIKILVDFEASSLLNGNTILKKDLYMILFLAVFVQFFCSLHAMDSNEGILRETFDSLPAKNPGSKVRYIF
ncbi:MAG: hypothetical protein ACTSXG_03140 [Alphaproteobacteria bacterium]